MRCERCSPMLVLVAVALASAVVAGPVSGGVDPKITVTGPDGRVRSGPPITKGWDGQGLVNHKQDTGRLAKAVETNEDPKTTVANPALTEPPEDTHAKQMQPAGHDNFQHAIPNFFEHEILYVENGIVLVWKPASGNWSTHRVNRDCGPDCPLVVERPLFEGTWPDMKFHKLTFAGCHAETGHGHLLDVDPRTGVYRIWLIDTSKPELLVHLAAQHKRLELTQYGVTYVSKDEILLHEGTSYRVYMLEPKLPIGSLRTEDPIGPFEPIDMGEFIFKEQVLFIGDGRVMDYSSTTGKYSVYLYDRTVTETDAPVSHLLGEGFIGRGYQLTVVGNGQLMMFNPLTGNYKTVSYATGSSVLSSNLIAPEGLHEKFIVPFSAKDKFYGFGSIIAADTCRVETNCSGCISKEGCGWCATNKECYRGRHEGPCVTNCTSWELNICPDTPCSAHKSCSACVADPFCGYCEDTKTCTEGSFAGPLFGSCQYSKMECPTRTKVAAEAGCEDEIR